MKKQKSFLLIILALVIALGMFTSCSSAGNAGDSYANFDDSEKITNEETEMGIASGEKLPTSAEQSARKIIKTFRITAETKDFDTALTGLETLVSDYNGYVESSSVSNRSINNTEKSYSRNAEYTLRIPAENADAFVGSMGDIFNVTRSYSTVDDVSETYYSIEAMLEELQAERDSLLAMMESVDSQAEYNFWLTLQQRLSEVKQEIAVYQRQLMNYDSLVSYSTITLTVSEVITYTEGEETDGFGTQLITAFTDGWSAFFSVIQGLVLLFVTVFPFLLLPAAVGIIVLIVYRRKKKKNDS